MLAAIRDCKLPEDLHELSGLLFLGIHVYIEDYATNNIKHQVGSVVPQLKLLSGTRKGIKVVNEYRSLLKYGWQQLHQALRGEAMVEAFTQGLPHLVPDRNDGPGAGRILELLPGLRRLGGRVGPAIRSLDKLLGGRPEVDEDDRQATQCLLNFRKGNVRVDRRRLLLDELIYSCEVSQE